MEEDLDLQHLLEVQVEVHLYVLQLVVETLDVIVHQKEMMVVRVLINQDMEKVVAEVEQAQ